MALVKYQSQSVKYQTYQRSLQRLKRTNRSRANFPIFELPAFAARSASGGDSAPKAPEHVIELSDGTQYRGTSFAAAFMSAAVLAELTKHSAVSYSSILSTLRNNADNHFSGYSTTQHGHGIVHI
jgi:hypothetical protein